MPDASILEIVDEVVALHQPSATENALRALASLGDRESLERLVAYATTGAADVQEKSVAIIAKLPPDRFALTVEALERLLSVPERADAAYAALGQIANCARTIRLGRLPFRLRLALAWRLFRRRRPSIGESFSKLGGRGFWGAVVSAIAATAVSVAALSRVYETIDVAIALAFTPFLGGILIGCMFAIVIGRRAAPINLYVDQRGALVAESLRAAGASLWPVPWAALLALLVQAATSGGSAGEFAFLWQSTLLAVCIALSIGLTRAGTLVGYETFSQSTLGNQATEAIVGGAFGVVGLGVMMSVASRITTSEGWNDALATTWVVLLPAHFGLASAFSTTDAPREPIAPVFGRASRLIAGAVIGLLLLATVRLSVVTTREGKTSTAEVDNDSGKDYLRIWRVRSFPSELTLNIDDPRYVGIAVSVPVSRPGNPALPTSRLSLRVRPRSQEVDRTYSDPPRMFATPLKTLGFVSDSGALRRPTTLLLSLEEISAGVRTPTRLQSVVAMFLLLRADEASAAQAAYAPDGRAVGDSVTEVRIALLTDTAMKEIGQFSQFATGLPLTSKLDSLPIRWSPVREYAVLLDAIALNQVCWRGTIAAKPRTIEAQVALTQVCDALVRNRPDDWNFVDSRAVNQGFNGKLSEARGNLRLTLEMLDESGRPDSTVYNARTAWLQAINKGENPFDDALGNALCVEAGYEQLCPTVWGTVPDKRKVGSTR